VKQKVIGPREIPTKLSSVQIRSQMGLTTDNELYYDKHVDRDPDAHTCVF